MTIISHVVTTGCSIFAGIYLIYIALTRLRVSFVAFACVQL